MRKWLIPLAVAIVCAVGLVVSATRGASTDVNPLTVPGNDPTSTVALDGPCHGKAAPSGGYKHVIWIVMGVRGYGDVMNPNSWAPNTRTLAAQCGIAGDYVSVAHPALPNVPALTAGTTNGITHNHCPCPVTPANVFKQVPSWKVYVGGMNGNCSAVASTAYDPDSNPPLVLGMDQDVCRRYDVPLKHLNADLKANRLPSLSVVVPSVCESMTYDKPCAGGSKQPSSVFVGRGDDWLGPQVDAIVKSKAYTSGSTAIFVTWQTGAGVPPKVDCLANRGLPSCRVATIVIAPSVSPGTEPPLMFSHYSLLRTTEELLGARGHLQQAARANSMRAPFSL
jgi:hypothetical protein